MAVQILLGIICCMAVAQDIRTGKIKNWFNLAAAVIGFGCVVWAGEPGMGESLAGLLFAAFLGFGLWRIGAVRAGDAKFMWALGILKGWKGFGVSMIYAALAGGVMAAAVILRKKDGKRRMLRVWMYVKHMVLFRRGEPYESENKEAFPFSVPLAAGCLLDTVLRL